MVNRSRIRALLAAGALCGLAWSWQTEPSERVSETRLLSDLDEFLAASGDFVMDVAITESRKDKEDREVRFQLIAKGRDRTLLKTLAPEEDRGRNILLRDREVWVYIPSVRRPFRVTLDQRLAGEVANGDVARSHLARDYRLSAHREESGSDPEVHQVLELTAKADDVIYPVIKMWVDSAGRPVRAEYFATSGRLLKECRFLDYTSILGKERPATLVLRDGLDPSRVSTIRYSNWTREPNIPDKFVTLSSIDKTDY